MLNPAESCSRPGRGVRRQRRALHWGTESRCRIFPVVPMKSKAPRPVSGQPHACQLPKLFTCVLSPALPEPGPTGAAPAGEPGAVQHPWECRHCALRCPQLLSTRELGRRSPIYWNKLAAMGTPKRSLEGGHTGQNVA